MPIALLTLWIVSFNACSLDSGGGGDSKVPKPRITGFAFDAIGLSATIDQAALTITVLITNGGNYASLAPTITHDGASVSPASGQEQDFTDPVSYVVTDSAGVSQTYTVIVKRPPSVTTTPIAAIAISGDPCLSVSIGGTIANARGEVLDWGNCETESGICWNTTGNPTPSDSFINCGTDILGSYSVTMDELTPNTTYYVRAYARNECGTVYGDVVSFDSGYPFGTEREREGGYVFYNDGSGGGLVAAYADLYQTSDGPIPTPPVYTFPWTPFERAEYLETGASIGSGYSNT
jgi:hypothetical protein